MNKIKKIVLPLLFVLTTVLFQHGVAMNRTQQGLKEISEDDLASHFFSENESGMTVRSLINDKKTDHRPVLYQKFSSRLTAYSGKKVFSEKRSFCKTAKYGKNRNKFCDCDEHNGSTYAQSWNVDKDGNIKVTKRYGYDESLSKDDYFEAKLSLGGIVRPDGFLSASNYRYALLMAWYTEDKNKDTINARNWSTNSKQSESREKVWKYRHNLTFEQAALCIALQHKCYEKNKDNSVPVKLGSHKYAYNVFCSLPMEAQNEIVHNLRWVKLPISRRVRNLVVNYPGLSSAALGGVMTAFSYKLLKKYSDS